MCKGTEPSRTLTVASRSLSDWRKICLLSGVTFTSTASENHHKKYSDDKCGTFHKTNKQTNKNKQANKQTNNNNNGDGRVHRIGPSPKACPIACAITPAINAITVGCKLQRFHINIYFMLLVNSNLFCSPAIDCHSDICAVDAIVQSCTFRYHKY